MGRGQSMLPRVPQISHGCADGSLSSLISHSPTFGVEMEDPYINTNTLWTRLNKYNIRTV